MTGGQREFREVLKTIGVIQCGQRLFIGWCDGPTLHATEFYWLKFWSRWHHFDRLQIRQCQYIRSAAASPRLCEKMATKCPKMRPKYEALSPYLDVDELTKYCWKAMASPSRWKQWRRRRLMCTLHKLHQQPQAPRYSSIERRHLNCLFYWFATLTEKYRGTIGCWPAHHMNDPMNRSHIKSSIGRRRV